MTDRAASIRHWLAPTARHETLKMVSSLTTVMKLKNWDEKTSGAILDTYEMDLADQPFFALQEACTAFRRMLVGDGWMPTPGELLVETKKKAEWLKTEAIEIERILSAEIVTEKPRVERASVRGRVDALIAQLRAARPKNEVARGFVAERTDEETPTSRLERLAKEYRDRPVKLSGDAKRRMAA